MSQPVEHSSGQTFAAEYFRPLLERQVGGDDHACPFVGRANHVEEQLRTQLACRDVTQLVEDQEVQFGELSLHPRQLAFLASLHQLRDQLGDSPETDSLSLLASGDSQY